jgi:hypothetical protein
VSKCSLCGKKASDKLLYLAKEKKHCREHLLEEFRKGFLAYKNKAVVFYPDINKSVNSYQYWFILKSGFDSLKSNNKEIDINVRTLLEKSLDLIAGPCQKCSKPAQVAYFGKNTFKWSEGSWPKPLIENILVKPEILCVECVLDKIEPPLRSYKGKFTEGICVPEKEDGALLMIII